MSAPGSVDQMEREKGQEKRTVREKSASKEKLNPAIMFASMEGGLKMASASARVEQLEFAARDL